MIRSTPIKCEGVTITGRRKEVCSNECLKAWAAKKEKEKELQLQQQQQQQQAEEEGGLASSSSIATTPPSSMSPISGNGVSPMDKGNHGHAPGGTEAPAGRKGRFEALCLYDRERGREKRFIYCQGSAGLEGKKIKGWSGCVYGGVIDESEECQRG